MSGPERIWVDVHFMEAHTHQFDDFVTPYIRLDIHEAAVAAARAEGMELAAKVCDRRAGNASDFDRYTRRAAGMCASDIRVEASK